MIELKTIIMQLIGGDTDGIRICKVEGESLVTIVIPRALLADAKKLPNIPPRGVYYLLDEDHGVLSRVYAGQTTQGVGRLESHKSKKEFWNKAVMFLDDSSNIDRDCLDGLEAAAIEYVRTHGSYETENAATPQPYVSAYKEGTIKRLHDSILFRMAALGYDLDREYSAPEGSAPVFHTKKNGIAASGRYDKDTGRFTVLAGSPVNLDRDVIKYAGASEARANLFGEAGGIVHLDDDLVFSSPSAAAVFVLGGSQNGWTEWVDESGHTLDSVYRNGED